MLDRFARDDDVEGHRLKGKLSGEVGPDGLHPVPLPTHLERLLVHAEAEPRSALLSPYRAAK